MKPKVTFPRWGHYTLAFEFLIKKLGGKAIIPENTTPQMISEGARVSPEMYCFPLKANLGNYLKAIEMGAEIILMVTSCGSCRLRYYGMVQEKILRDLGKKVQFIIFDQNPKEVYLTLRKLFKKSFFEIGKALFQFWQRIKLIEEIEKISWKLRPREIIKGETDKIFRESLEKMREEKKPLSLLKKEIFSEFSKIKIEKGKKVPRVGIVGEIFMACEPSLNFDIEKKLGNLGVEVQKEVLLSYHLTKKIFLRDFFMEKKVKDYLGSRVGGHGMDAVYEMLKYIKEGMDGVVQILPFSCMPEVTVRPILERIHQKKKVPFLSLSIDEQIAEAGFNTRLEAFVDVVESYFKNSHKDKLT